MRVASQFRHPLTRCAHDARQETSKVRSRIDLFSDRRRFVGSFLFYDEGLVVTLLAIWLPFNPCIWLSEMYSSLFSVHRSTELQSNMYFQANKKKNAQMNLFVPFLFCSTLSGSESHTALPNTHLITKVACLPMAPSYSHLATAGFLTRTHRLQVTSCDTISTVSQLLVENAAAVLQPQIFRRLEQIEQIRIMLNAGVRKN